MKKNYYDVFIPIQNRFTFYGKQQLIRDCLIPKKKLLKKDVNDVNYYNYKRYYPVWIQVLKKDQGFGDTTKGSAGSGGGTGSSTTSTTDGASSVFFEDEKWHRFVANFEKKFDDTRQEARHTELRMMGKLEETRQNIEQRLGGKKF
jgi:hypothetical protein